MGMDNKKLIERLEICYKEKGLTRTAFAKDIGIKESTIRNWSRKDSIPSVANIYEIAKYFGVPMEYLLGVEDSPIDDDEAAMILKMKKMPAERKKHLLAIADTFINLDKKD